jgi:SecD/SecF fusion protein
VAADDAEAEEKIKDTATVIGIRLGQDGRAFVRDGRIVVEVFGEATTKRLAAIRRRVSTVGALQFRIMAAPGTGRHEPIIAMAQESDAHRVLYEGRTIGQWFDCDPGEFKDRSDAVSRGLVTRQREGKFQALAILDDGLDLTGAYLKDVSATADETGQPQIDFVFGPRGAELLGELTGKNLPMADGRRRLLGLIVDDVVLSAPSIESKITSRGRISGSMTQEEVSSLVAVLRAGQLPYPIREIGSEILAGGQPTE